MSSNYNGMPRPEVVMVRDGQATVIGRHETLDDLLALRSCKNPLRPGFRPKSAAPFVAGTSMLEAAPLYPR
jgi:hypothetical protein